MDLLNISSILLLFFPLSLFLGNAVIEIIIGLIGALFLFHSLQTKNFSWLKRGWVKISLLLWAYFCIRSTWAEDPLLSFSRGTPYIRFIIFAAAIAHWIIPGHQDKSYLVKALFISVIIASCSAITQFLVGFDFVGNPVFETGHHLRLTTFSGKLSVGIILTMIFFPAASYLISHHRRSAVPYVILAFSAILLSGERTAFILFITGFFIMIALNKGFRPYLVYLAIAIAILGSGLLMTKSEVLKRQVITSYIEIRYFEQTTYGKIFRISWDNIKENPIFGTGLRHFQKKCFSDEYQPIWVDSNKIKDFKSYHCVTHPHNIYLELFGETGIIGFSLFLLLIYSILHFAWVNRNNISADAFKIGALINILLKLFPFVSISSLFFAWANAPFWFMLGILFSVSNHTSKHSKY